VDLAGVHVERRLDVLVDEAHHATASTYRALIDRISPDAVIGVTATPCRMSGEPLREVFDRLHIGPSVPHLIGRGVLVEPEIYAPPPGAVAALLEGVNSRGGDYQRSQLSDRVVGLAGRTVAMYQQLADGTQAVVFCVTVKHAQRVAEQFTAAGISAQIITGKQGKREREQVVDSYRVGRTRVLCSVDVVSEGFDLPAIETAILARPTQSLALYLQQVGRALRCAPGKHGAVVIDQAGNVHRHGTPDALRRWSLDRAPVIVDDDKPTRKIRELEPRAALGVSIEEVDAALVRIRARESLARAKPPKHEQQGAELFLRVSTDPAYPDTRCEGALRWAREEHRRGWGRYVAPDDLAA
ncbi:DEAD/DEAH box helicase, partial [Sphingomonas sp.]|uniref:DEAD/DEAH box helicase n=1 Tax=Sphingomonas sp. TaxID=28214 RepID=UPI0025852ACD